jgi:hypothetical protein
MRTKLKYKKLWIWTNFEFEQKVEIVQKFEIEQN